MTTPRKAAPEDFRNAAKLIKALCEYPATQCVHSATSETVDSVVEEMVKWHEADEMTWAISTSGSEIIGVMGCEFEIESGRGWLRGPFALKDYENLTNRLWNAVRDQVPQEITRFDSFLNIENLKGQAFYESAGFIEKGRAHVYAAPKERFLNIDRSLIADLSITPLTTAHYDSFAQLHDQVFAGTYITGTQIIKKLDENHCVWVYVEEGAVLGYLYGVIETWSEEGYIEFVGVAEQARRSGIGGALLFAALDWFFNKRETPAVGLTVDDGNMNARTLYERVMFQHKYTGVNQRLEN